MRRVTPIAPESTPSGLGVRPGPGSGLQPGIPAHRARSDQPAHGSRSGRGGGPDRVRVRHPRIGLPAGVGRRGAPTRRVAGPRAHRAGAHRRAPRVRRRLHLRLQGRGEPRQVRAARARQHDRRQPVADRGRLVAGCRARGLAHQEHRPQARLRRRARHRRRARATARDRDHVPCHRHALLADAPAQAHADDRRLGDPHRDLRAVRRRVSGGRRRRSRTSWVPPD